MDKTLLEVDTGTFRTRDYENEYKNSKNSEERTRIINEFIRDFCVANGIPEDGLGFQDALENQISSYGSSFLRQNNAFLKWIVNFSDYNGPDSLREISNDDYNNLIELYGKNIIVEKDLRGTGPRKTATPIFVRDFFNKSFQDMSYLAQVFFWMEISANLDNVYNAFSNMMQNKDEVDDVTGVNTQSNASDNLKEFANYLGDVQLLKVANNLDDRTAIKNLNTEKENFVYFILFRDKKFNFNGEFRDTRNISNALDYLNNFNTSEKTVSSNDYRSYKIDKNKYKSLDKLSDREAREMIAYLIQTRNIKL